MAKLARQGDTNSVGGKIKRGAKSVYANGIPVGLHVSEITPHPPNGKRSGKPHKIAKTKTASNNVYAEGQQVLKVGSTTTCGHPIVNGSDNVYVP